MALINRVGWLSLKGKVSFSSSLFSSRNIVSRSTPSLLLTRTQWDVTRARGIHLSHAALLDGLEIRMPSLSPTMQQGTIIKWHKKEGESVSAGDVLCDIQTDKAVLGFEVEEEGILAKILIGDNSPDVKIGTLIALITEPGSDWKSVTVPSTTTPTTPKTTTTTPTAAPSTAPSTPAPSTRSAKHARESYGPAVRSILEVYNIQVDQVKPSGPHNRLLKGDLLKFIKEKGLKPSPVAVHPPPAPAAAAAGAKPSTPASTPASPAAHQRPAAASGGYTDLPLSGMRTVIAQRLTLSKTTIPHSYATIDCKMDNLLRLRKELLGSGVKVGVNDFIIKAAAIALQRVPGVNSVWSGSEGKQLSNIDISVAVATDNGLITPIVKDAINLSVEDISLRVKDLAGRARAGKLKLDEFQGGSFTISNLGMFGISSFSAVINPPQTCILAVGGSRSVLVPHAPPASSSSSASSSSVVSDVDVQTLLSVTVSCDARVVDDVLASHFLSVLAETLDNPMGMFMGSTTAARQSSNIMDKLYAK